MESIKQWLLALTISGIAYLSPIKSTLVAVGFLIFIDTFTGLWAAFKLNQKIESYKLRQMITKSAIYSIAIITGYVLQQELMGPDIPVVKLIAGSIGAVEGLSVMENLNKLQKLPFLKALMEKIQPEDRDKK